MSEIAGVFAVWKLKGPCQGEIVVPILAQIVPIVLDLVSYSLPANIMSLGLFFRIEQWAHTPIVKTSRLGEVDNSESVDYSCSGISDLEIVPLGVFVCEEVRAHSQLVFIFSPSADCRSQTLLQTAKCCHSRPQAALRVFGCPQLGNTQNRALCKHLQLDKPQYFP